MDIDEILEEAKQNQKQTKLIITKCMEIKQFKESRKQLLKKRKHEDDMAEEKKRKDEDELNELRTALSKRRNVAGPSVVSMNVDTIIITDLVNNQNERQFFLKNNLVYVPKKTHTFYANKEILFDETNRKLQKDPILSKDNNNVYTTTQNFNGVTHLIDFKAENVKLNDYIVNGVFSMATKKFNDEYEKIINNNEIFDLCCYCGGSKHTEWCTNNDPIPKRVRESETCLEKITITDIITQYENETVEFRVKLNKLILFSRGRNSYLYQVDGRIRFEDIGSMECEIPGCYKFNTHNKLGYRKFINRNVWFNDYKITGIDFKKNKKTYDNAVNLTKCTVRCHYFEDRQYCSYCGCLTTNGCIDRCENTLVVLKSVKALDGSNVEIKDGIVHLNQSSFIFECEQDLSFDKLIYSDNTITSEEEKNSFNFNEIEGFMNFQENVIMDGKRVYGVCVGNTESHQKIVQDIDAKFERDRIYKRFMNGENSDDCLQSLFENIINMNLKKYNTNWIDMYYSSNNMDVEKANKIKLGFLKYLINARKNWNVVHENVDVTIKYDNLWICTIESITFYSFHADHVIDWLDNLNHERCQLVKKTESLKNVECCLSQLKYSYEKRDELLCIFRKDSELSIKKIHEDVCTAIIWKYNSDINFINTTFIKMYDIKTWYENGTVPKCPEQICRGKKLYLSYGKKKKDDKKRQYICYRKDNIECGISKSGTVKKKPIWETI